MCARLLPLPPGSDGQTPVAKVFLDLGVATVGLAARFANRLPLTTTLPLPSIEGHEDPFGARKILRQKLVQVGVQRCHDEKMTQLRLLRPSAAGRRRDAEPPQRSFRGGALGLGLR